MTRAPSLPRAAATPAAFVESAQSTRASTLERALAAIAFLFLAWFLACALNSERDKAADDAFITYVYGRNLAEGRGLRFNASDADPTGGASSTLHVLIAAAANRAGVEPLLATRALGIACLLGVALAFGLTAARIARVPSSAGILAGTAGVFGLAMLPETALHLASGMETLLFATAHALVIAWAAWMLARDRALGWGAGLASALLLDLLLLARPEGGFLVAAYLAALAIARRERGLASSVRALLPVALPFAASVAALLAWRWLYFGDVFSNPYYVKAHNGIFGSAGDPLPGLDTTWRFALLRYGPLLGLVAILAAALQIERSLARRALWLLAPSALVLALYARAIHEMAGGYRYEYPTIVPLWGALALGLCALRARSSAWFQRALLGGFVLVPLLAAPISPDALLWLLHPRSAATDWLRNEPQQNALERLGLDLRDTGLGERATVLLSGAGQVPWYSRFRSIDWIGLNENRLCGRTPMSMDEVWSYIDEQHPDVVYSILPPAAPGSTSAGEDANFASENVRRTLGGRGSALFKHWDPAKLREMFWREMRYVRERCEFGACYKLGAAWGDDWWLFAYVKKDSPEREKLLEVLRQSKRSDVSSDLGLVFPFDPRELR